MKHLLTLSESAELELLKHILEKGGIQCVLKNAEIAQALPTMPFAAELWVVNDKDLLPAQALCDDWFAPAHDASNHWVCSACGQRLGSRFDACWKCGTKREITNKLEHEGAIVL
jgi:ribosomal protein L40E